jgi:UDP-glucose 4-epimerase
VARVLVTGAAGFLGSHLTERLLEAGHEVVGVDCFTPYYDPARKRQNLAGALAHPRFRLLELDLAEAAPARLPDADVVYHLAAQAGVRASWGAGFADYLHHNLLATQRLLERYARGSPARLVYASSSSIYGDAERLPTRESDLPRPHSPYGVTKLAAEHLCFVHHRNFGAPVVALRYFTVYGPRQRPDMAFHRFIEALAGGRPLELMGDGRQTRDFTFVDDAVAAALAAGERGRPGAIYNVGSARPVSLLAVCDLLGALSGRKPRLEFRPRAAGDASHTAADITRARDDLGYEPRTRLEDGLARQWSWQRASRTAPAGTPGGSA